MGGCPVLSEGLLQGSELWKRCLCGETMEDGPGVDLGRSQGSEEAQCPWIYDTRPMSSMPDSPIFAQSNG